MVSKNKMDAIALVLTMTNRSIEPREAMIRLERILQTTNDTREYTFFLANGGVR